MRLEPPRRLPSRFFSASFYPAQVVHFEETFFAALDGLDDRVEAAIDRFRNDNDGWKCFSAVTGEYDRFLTIVSYLLGHLNGLGGDIESAPKFKEFLEGPLPSTVDCLPRGHRPSEL